MPRHQPRLEALELRIAGAGGVDISLLERTFPTVAVHVRGPGEVDLDHAEWRRPELVLEDLDRRAAAIVAAGRPLRLGASSAEASRLALQVLTRVQRLVRRRNAASEGPLFDRLLAELDALAARAEGLELARDRGLDAWQWALRLEPGAGAELQLALLVSGVEELAVEGRAILARVGAPRAVAAAALELAGAPSGDPSRTLEDAEALAFLSLGSAPAVDALGPSQARRRIAHALGRASVRAIEQLPRIRLRPDVAAMVAEVLEAPFRSVEATG